MPDQNDPLDDYLGSDDAARRREEPQAEETPRDAGQDVPADELVGQESAVEEGPAREAPAKRESLTQSIKRQTTTMRAESPRQYRGLLIIAGCTVVGLIIIIAFVARPKGQARSAPGRVTPGYDTAEDVNARFDRFMNTVSTELVSLKQEVTNSRAASEQLNTQVSAQLAAQAEAQRALQVRVETELATIRNQASAPMVVEAPIAKGDLDAFVQVLKRQRTKGSLPLSEARLRLETYLGQQGFTGKDLAIMRDRCLDQLGFLYVGEVAEAPLSDDELAVLPEGLRAATKELATYNRDLAETTGRVILREEDSVKWLRQTVGEAKAQEFGAANLAKAAYLARVRKENATPEQEALLPDLAAERDRVGIALGDTFRTEALVFEQKRRWPLMTPGQHLSLTMALSGRRSQGSGNLEASAPRSATADDRALIERAAGDAIRLALGQNQRDQRVLLDRARAAAKAKVEDLGVTLPAAALDSLALNVLAETLRGGSGAAAPTTPANPGRVDAPKAAPITAQIVELHLGPFALRQHQAGLYAWLLAGLAAERLKISADTAEGAAALSAAWTAAPLLGETAWAATAERGGDLRAFANVVTTELHHIFEAGRRAGGIPTSIAGLDGLVADLTQAAVLGQVAGSTYDADRQVQDQALQRALATLQKDGARISALGDSEGLRRLAAIWRGLGYPTPGMAAERGAEVLEVLRRQLVERRVAHEQVLLAGFPPEFRDKVVRGLNDDLILTLPATVAQSDDGKMAADLLERLVIAGENRYSVAAISEAILSAQGVKEVVDRFAALVDRDDMIQNLYQAMAAWIPDQVHTVLESAKPTIKDENLGPLGREVAEKIAPDLVQFLAKQVILNNLSPRMAAAAGDLNHAGLERAMDHLKARLQDLALKPVTPANVDKLTQTLHSEGLSVIEGAAGMRPGRSAGPADGNPRPLPTRPPFFDVQDQGLPGVPLGMRQDTIDNRVRSIPMGSSMYCVLETGAVIAVKQNENTATVYFRAARGFLSPSGTWFQFPNTVLKGVMKPNLNGNSISVELQAMSFDLPNGVRVEKEITGMVVNQVDGVAGMLAKFHRNWDKIMPEAATVGVLQGVSAAIENETQNVEVTTTGSTIVTSGGDAAAAGFGEGINEGVELATDYARSYMDSISPTLEAPNGQPLTAIFGSTIDFPELSDADWASFTRSAGKAADGF